MAPSSTKTPKDAIKRNHRTVCIIRDATINLICEKQTSHVELGREKLISILLSSCSNKECNNNSQCIHNTNFNPPDFTKKGKQHCEICSRIYKVQRFFSKSMIYFRFSIPNQNGNANGGSSSYSNKVFVSGVNASKLYLNKRKICSQTLLKSNISETSSQPEEESNTSISSFQDSAGKLWHGGLPFHHNDFLTFVDTDKAQFRFGFHLQIAEASKSEKSSTIIASKPASSSSHSPLLTLQHFSQFEYPISKPSEPAFSKLSYSSLSKVSSSQNNERCHEEAPISHEQLHSLKKALPASSQFYNSLLTIMLEKHNCCNHKELNSNILDRRGFTKLESQDQLELPDLLRNTTFADFTNIEK